MNEQLQEKVTVLLDWVDKAAQTSSAFVAEQTPLLIQEILRYNFWTSLTLFLVGVLLFIVPPIITYIYRKNVKDAIIDEDGTLDPGIMFIGTYHMSFLVGGFIIMVANMDWFKILVAPRLYIVEYLKHFMN